ncbi:hypothetical protein OYC64_016418 [Pagothenia borchgrevinki]|uniref:Pyrin domain-containing protein n=1 Tax=Pagothenia borchgrevinki TaxID=8213 RepID=A0ABD2HKQ5_PAGBO
MVDKLLLRTLKDLGKDAFQEFKWHLKQENFVGVEPIAESDLEDADRGQTVTQMTRSYEETTAVEVAVKILKEISNRKAAAELTKKYAEMVRAASSSSSSSAAAASPPAASPPAANTMSAENGSVIVAPTVSGSIHTLNLTINK